MDAFTSVMNAYHVRQITSLPHYPQSNGPAGEYVHILRSLIYKAKKREKIYSSV